MTYRIDWASSSSGEALYTGLLRDSQEQLCNLSRRSLYLHSKTDTWQEYACFQTPSTKLRRECMLFECRRTSYRRSEHFVVLL